MTRHWPGMAVVLVLLCALWGTPAFADSGAFSNSSAITLGAAGQAAPSTIDVSGLAGGLDSATVSLSGVMSSSASLDVLLVAPNGKSVLLESDVNAGAEGSDWTYADGATPQTTGATGTYSPTNVDGGSGNTDSFTAPAPTGNYGSALMTLYGQSPDGNWQLYLRDDNDASTTIAGWSLDLHTTPDVAPLSKDFGTLAVGSGSRSQSFTVTNTGANPLDITSTGIQGPDAADFSIASDACAGQSLATGASCTLSVAFRPSAAGARSATLVIDDTSGGSAHSLPLSGTATQSGIAISPTTLDFGAVPFGEKRVLGATITSTGSAPLALPLLQPSNLDFEVFHGEFAGAPCPLQLAPGDSCVLPIEFTPTVTGTRTATISIADDAPGAPHVITLVGTELGRPAQFVESGSPEITIDSRFTTRPELGVPTALDITVSDLNERVTGVIVDFGEALGRYGESACVAGVNKGGSSSFHIPYTFLTPGPHTVAVTAFAGGCGKATAHTSTFLVELRPPLAARRSAHAAETLAGPDITSKCRDALLVPTSRNGKRTAKALVCVINEQRKLAKLRPVKISRTLTKAALTHTRNMVKGRFFAHQGPKEPALVTRLKKVRYRRAAGENLGAGAGSLGTPLAIVNGWMHSALHRANLLSRRWKTVGIGLLPQFPVPGGGPPAATYTADFGVR